MFPHVFLCVFGFVLRFHVWAGSGGEERRGRGEICMVHVTNCGVREGEASSSAYLISSLKCGHVYSMCVGGRARSKVGLAFGSDWDRSVTFVFPGPGFGGLCCG